MFLRSFIALNSPSWITIYTTKKRSNHTSPHFPDTIKKKEERQACLIVRDPHQYPSNLTPVYAPKTLIL